MSLLEFFFDSSFFFCYFPPLMQELAGLSVATAIAEVYCGIVISFFDELIHVSM